MESNSESTNPVCKVLCVLPVLGQPRHAKRISMLTQEGFEVEAAAFRRDYHRGRLPNCEIKNLGKIKSGNYIQRIFTLITSLPALRRSIRDNQVVYAFGLDMSLVAIIAGIGLGRGIILEVGDIERLQVSPCLKGLIIRMLDRYVAHVIKLLVVTASGYVEGYYHKWLNIQPPVLVLENKLEPITVKSNDVHLTNENDKQPFVDRPLRIGYFGLLRCDWSWNVLETLANTRPDDIEIIVAGRPMIPVDLIKRVEKLANIKYIGEYKSPDDLPGLYESVDIVWGCYPAPVSGDYNWRWARTNRFYESCLFQKPIITLSGTSDAVEVDRHGIGVSITNLETKATINTLLEISQDDLARWKENLKRLPRNVYEYTVEATDLAIAIRNITVS